MPFKFNPFSGNLDYYFDEAGVNTGDVTLAAIGSSPNANTFSTLDLETQDARDLVYTYLKTLPGYNGAVDV